MSKSQQISCPPRSITHHHRHRRRVCHILQNCPDGVGSPFDDQTHQRGGEVGAQALRGDELLQLSTQGDLCAIFTDGAVVHQEEIGVVFVQAHEARSVKILYLF